MTTTPVSFVIVAKRAYGTGRIFIKHDAYYGSWRLYDGRRTTRKLGSVRKGRVGLTKTDAEKKLREFMLADNTGPAIISRAGTPTIEQLGEAALAQLRRDLKKKSYIETFQGHLRAHINKLPLGPMLVTDVTRDDVDRFLDRLITGTTTRKPLAPKTVHNIHGTLHVVLERAVQKQMIEHNPAHLVKLPRIPKAKGLNFLTTDELYRVIDTPLPDLDEDLLNGFPDDFQGPQAVRDWWPVVRLAILMAAMTGLRLGELRGLRWRDLGVRLRVGDNYVRGVFDDAKSTAGHGRGVPIAKRVLDELEEHHKRTVWNAENDLVLAHPHTGQPLHRGRLALHYHAALTRAGVKQVRFHDLRHTFGTVMAASGNVSIRTLQEWMGHESWHTTQIYSHYMPAEREAEMIDDAFSPRRDGLQTDSKPAHSEHR